MTQIRQALTCVLLLVLIVVSCYAAGFLLAATVTVASGPGEMRDTRVALTAQVAAARVDALKEIDKQADALRAELHGDVRLVDAQVTAISGKLDKRVGDSLQRVDVALKTVKGIRKDLQPVLVQAKNLVSDADVAVSATKPALDHAASITAQVDDGLPLFLDCDHNPDCVFNRFQGTSKAVERTMSVIALAAPEAAKAAIDNEKNVAGITADVHTITTAATKPKSFWGKVWAGITVASRFAGLL